ncbi:response regulator transcription factor [Clostridium guangxiense]|uniref:response regulator transcription factor n=1 Tax=Clostridium guangxiense TaxID=1662055 RepID=UPI001E4DF3A5|nr:response regulator transcription factor [Clostridium guangxiense]MCD2348862.1 response regulator transcription factor [Clostridium guangxiense]
MPKKLIYIADDEIKIQKLIEMFLVKEGYEVITYSNGEDLLEAFKEKRADMLILDIMMPGIDGLALCAELRKISNVPIIIISAKDSETDKIAGLMLGSDDYMTKPFSPVELVLRVKKIFRLIDVKTEERKDSNLLKILDVNINIDSKTVYCNGKKLKFTPIEFNLLLYLAQNLNKGVSREELLNKIWGFNSDVDTRATDDMMKRIRRKLAEADSSLKIETLWGFGFMISDENR